MADYSLAGLDAGPPVTQWPADVSLELDTSRPTLILAAHPQCSCTRASLDELAVIRARAGKRLHIVVLFAQIEGVELRSYTWRQAASIPDVVVSADPDGEIAERLGARSSGQTFVYDPAGRLLFSGGITASRGHAGDNVGRAAVLAIARGEGVERKGPPAFGCGLRSHSRQAPAS